MSANEAIQVDMFAVGLGAAVLTQFLLDDGSRVSVLSDGGMETGKPPDTVLSKLPGALDDFLRNGPRRIDLIVGTHYDGDHLKGLLPIIEDVSIEIGDVWLPPVTNDSDEILETVEARGFLARQLFDDEDWSFLLGYLFEKAREVDELQDLESIAWELLRPQNEEHRHGEPRPLPYYSYKGQVDWTEFRRHLMKTEGRIYRHISSRHSSSDAKVESPPHVDLPDPNAAIEVFDRFFRSHENKAVACTGNGSIHDCGVYDSRSGCA